MTTSRLLSLAEILPAGLGPIAATPLAPAQALGAIAAEDFTLPEAWPRAAVAREPGYAVAARAMIGATAYEPALLPASTSLLAAGDILPDQTDAILPVASVLASPLGLEAFTTIRPGEGVRRAGQDWPAGRPLVKAGMPVGAIEQAMLMTLQVPEISVRRVAVSLDLALPEAIRALFARWTERLGVVISTPGEAHLLLESRPLLQPRLALRPGRFGALNDDGGAFALAVPPDLAEAFGLWHALALPILAGLAGARLAAIEGRLASKIVSGIGMTELVFLRRAGEDWLPLETGDATMATLAETEAVALIPAGSEGQSAGASLMLMPLGGAFETLRHGSYGQ